MMVNFEEQDENLDVKPGGGYDGSEPRCLWLAKQKQWTAIETLIQQLRKTGKWSELGVRDPTNGMTLMMYACQENRRAIFEQMIDLGIDFKLRAYDGMTALHFAAASTADIIVTELVQRGADTLAIGGPDEQLPLHIACQRPSSALLMAKCMLHRMPYEARLIVDKDGYIPVAYAVRGGNDLLVQELVSELPVRQCVEWREQKTQNTLLHISTVRRDLKTVRVLLTNGHADINAQNVNGQTALHFAAMNNDDAMMRCLASFNADPNIKDTSEETPIFYAARAGAVQMLRFLADVMKADVQLRSPDGSTLMHIAAQHGHIQCLLALVKRDVPLHMPNKSGFLSLHLAAQNGHTEAVKTLLEHGAPIDARTKDRYTAMHLAVLYNKPEVIQLLMGCGAKVGIPGGLSGEQPLHVAARTNAVECAKMLLLTGAQLDAPTGQEQETPLHMAARRGYDRLFELLIKEGANVHCLSRSGESVLHVAARHSHYPIVKLFLKYVKREYLRKEVVKLVNLATVEGETALHLACGLQEKTLHYVLEDSDIIRTLLKNGADPNIPTKHTLEIPLHYCARVGNVTAALELVDFMGHNFPPLTNRQARDGWSPLLTACHYGHSELVDLFTRKNARVDLFDEQGLAALHLAAEKGFIECCELLLEKKAFINLKTKIGITPLHLAAANGFNELVRLLIEKHHATIDVITLEKKTPLHFAAEFGHKDVAKSLVELGANVHAVDSLGQTPLHLAAECDHPDVVQMFLKFKPELVFTANHDGMTCAHIAAAKGSVAVLKALMRFNRSVVISARNKTTDSLPLHLAAEGGHGDVVGVLIDAGSPPLDENGDGMTCIHLAVKEGFSTVLAAIPQSVSWDIPSKKTGLTPLHIAVFYARVDMVRELLTRVSPVSISEQPTSYNIKDEKLRSLIDIDYGLTALHVACYAGVDPVVRLLLNLPEVDVRTKSAVMQISALHLAAQKGSLTVSGLLLAKSTKLLGQEDARGFKPLHLAARNGHIDMVASLVGQGSDINTTDNHGWVPLHHACRCGHIGVVKLLLELGASVIRATRDDRVPLSLSAASGQVDVFMYLLQKEHQTNELLQDHKFVLDLVKVARMNKQKAIEEFILVSKCPLATAAFLSSLFLEHAESKPEHMKELEAASRFCEKMTSSLMTIGALQSSPSRILQATDAKGKSFIDELLDGNLKEVVAESAVQHYLSDIWGGKLEYGGAGLTVIFLSFVFCPLVILYFLLPLKHGYHRVPLIKFLAQLASHLQFIFVLSTVCVTPLVSLVDRQSFIPTWNEYLLLIWLGGMLTADLTNPTSGSSSRMFNGFILGFSAIAVVLQIIAITYDVESYEANILMYIRNQVLSIPAFLSPLFIIEFLTFHHRFGPLTIILNYIINDTSISTAIMLIFYIGYWLQLNAIFAPICPDLEPELTSECICNVRVPDYCSAPFIQSILHPGIPGCRSHDDYIGTLTTNFQLLYGALLHHGDYIWQASVRNSPEWLSAFHRFHISEFHVIMVLTILTLIISTSADTYERMNRRSDLEWKFERAKLIRNMFKTAPLPSPFNMFAKPFFYLNALIKYKRWMCTSYAPYFMMIDEVEEEEEEEEENLEQDEEAGASLQSTSRRQVVRKASFGARLVSWLKRCCGGSSSKNRVGDADSATAVAVAATTGGMEAPAKIHHKRTVTLLEDVIDWKRVVERYREVEAEEGSEDEFIEELDCNLSELEEWQAELWEEAEEIEEEEVREIFRRWLVEEFKEVVKS